MIAFNRISDCLVVVARASLLFRLWLLLTALFIFFRPAAAVAWGDDGHKVIAHIAEHYLYSRAREQIQALLAADRDTLTLGDFASRATWADKFRNQAYAETEKWHYTDIEIDAPDIQSACYGRKPLPPRTFASQGPPQACAVDKVIQFASELADPEIPLDERLLAFKFLLHLVGDIHQPLHSADDHDRGGNSIYVVFGDRIRPIKLHGYWDSEIVHAIGRSPEFVADAMIKQFGDKFATWSKGSPQDWAMETFNEAREHVYRVGDRVGEAKGGAPVYRIDQMYEHQAHLIARQQLTKAGMRLAATLNKALGGQ